MSRLFVIDPVCAMTYGHSLNALSYFAETAATYVKKVQKVASRHLPADPGKDDGVLRYFDFHYDFALKISRAPQGNVLPVAAGPADAEGISSQEFYSFLEDQRIGPSDVLLFPSTDYYALIGVLNALRGLPRDRHPRLMLRFIGVMESAHQTVPHADAFQNLIERLKEALGWKTQISVCAETPKYAARLGDLLGSPVLTVPYFAPALDPLPIPDGGPRTFLLGGSARSDKGFFRLADIISRVNELVRPEDVSFIIQGPPDDILAHNADYMARLYALPNTRILKGTLAYCEIVESFRRSHVALMPYARDVYEFRGSAMLMEALMFNRPVICQGGTGFSDQASAYRAGDICADDHEFARSIAAFSLGDPVLMYEQAALSRRFYLEDVRKSCDAWFEGALR